MSTYNQTDELKTYKIVINQENVEQIIKSIDPQTEVIKSYKIFYPYMQIVAEIEARMLFEVDKNKTICLIDLLNGSETIVDFEPEICSQHVLYSEIIPRKITQEEALRKGEGYLNFMSSYKKKVLTVPRIDIKSVQELYKAYWIVECVWKENSIFSLLVDSVTGQYHSIPN